MTPLKKIPMWLAILALTFNGFSRSGLVLCIADEGHLAVEVACVETSDNVVCCSSEHDEHSIATLIEDRNCGGCSDLMLRSHPPILRKSVLPVISASFPVFMPFLTDMIRPSGDAPVLLRTSGVVSPSTGGHLQTVVLRL